MVIVTALPPLSHCRQPAASVMAEWSRPSGQLPSSVLGVACGGYIRSSPSTAHSLPVLPVSMTCLGCHLAQGPNQPSV